MVRRWRITENEAQWARLAATADGWERPIRACWVPPTRRSATLLSKERPTRVQGAQKAVATVREVLGYPGCGCHPPPERVQASRRH